jgi:hypothetical protein
MVTLAQALQEATATPDRTIVGRLLADMSEGDAALLIEALHGPLPSARLAKALEAAGYSVGRNALDGWRQRNAATRL